MAQVLDENGVPLVRGFSVKKDGKSVQAKYDYNYLANKPTDDNSLGIQDATVGQIAEVTKVDASGKPLEWKAVDKLSGGADAKDVTAVVPSGLTAEKNVQSILDSLAAKWNTLINRAEVGA